MPFDLISDSKDDYTLRIGFINEELPILQDFNSLWEQLKADNNCTRNYNNHVATWYGNVDYAYTGVRHHAQSWHPEFEELARTLDKELGFQEGYFNCLLANLYTGKGIAPHSDDEEIFIKNDGTIGAVATISLGGTAIATITNKNHQERDPLKLRLRDRSCYVMPEGNFQSNYKHQVSKPEASNPHRISLTFRHIPRQHPPL